MKDVKIIDTLMQDIKLEDFISMRTGNTLEQLGINHLTCKDLKDLQDQFPDNNRSGASIIMQILNEAVYLTQKYLWELQKQVDEDTVMQND